MRSLVANAFEIGFPEGWEDHSTVVMVGPLRETFSPNVQVNQEALPQGMSVQEYVAAQRKELSTLEGFQAIEHGERQLAGQHAEYHSYSWRIPQGPEIRQMQLATLRGGVLYTVTASALVDDWPHVEAAIASIVANFQWR